MQSTAPDQDHFDGQTRKHNENESQTWKGAHAQPSGIGITEADAQLASKSANGVNTESWKNQPHTLGTTFFK